MTDNVALSVVVENGRFVAVSLVFHRRTASFGRQIDENSRLSSGVCA
jgi:hypothetical protein